jgi:hypothetical protein
MNKPFDGGSWLSDSFVRKRHGCLGVGFEALCLSTQFVISLSAKTLLKNVVLKLFLLNSATFLRAKSFVC